MGEQVWVEVEAKEEGWGSVGRKERGEWKGKRDEKEKLVGRGVWRCRWGCGESYDNPEECGLI